VKPHIFKILHEGLRENTDLREKIAECRKIEDFEEIV
jgi:hypothetical protein